MSAAILPELALSPDRIRFTREEAAKMAESGLIEGRYELLRGELISKMGQKPPHSWVITKLNGILVRQFGGDRVRIQLPIRLPDPEGIHSEPEPDVVLLCREDQEFLSRHPGPPDIALLIEVSDTTFDRDRGVKYHLYASAGIAEYWVIDIQQRRTFVCRRPFGSEYQSVEIIPSGEPLVPVAGPFGERLTLEGLLS